MKAYHLVVFQQVLLKMFGSDKIFHRCLIELINN